MNLREVLVGPVERVEEERYQELMQEHHYLGRLPKISETLWCIGLWQNQWVALLSFPAAAWKCAARDQRIGWSSRHQYDRLKLVTNNSRFLILPDWHVPNLGSRIWSLCQKRLPADWQETFGHPVMLLETFVDPQHFRGTVYRAANWLHVGETKGFRRTGKGYSAKSHLIKREPIYRVPEAGTDGRCLAGLRRRVQVLPLLTILVSVRKGFFSALGRWDRHASRSVEISAVAAEASTGSITDLDAPRGGTHVRLRANPRFPRRN